MQDHIEVSNAESDNPEEHVHADLSLGYFVVRLGRYVVPTPSNPKP